MKAIPLTQDMVAVVDDEDFVELSKYKWQFNQLGYAIRTDWNNGSPKAVYMHRQLLGDPDGLIVDHINQDKLDNRKINLRTCKHRENLQNRGKQANNTTGYSGVIYRKDKGKYYSTLTSGGKTYRLGYFKCKHDAARMYNFWAADIHGEFACLNKIEG